MKTYLQDTCQDLACAAKNLYENAKNSISGLRRQKSEADIIIENIKEARSEMEQAESLFNELTDSAAVDYASYSIMAARSKYIYLLKLAKEKGVRF